MLVYGLCLILLLMVQISMSTTSIKTFSTINLHENVPINTKVVDLKMDEEERGEVKRWKLALLNLGGFETNLFEIKNEKLLTKSSIDREQLLIEKRCFDRLYCLIEVHILVNDGEKYLVIPIHIVDENDNKPQFKSSSIELKFEINNLNEFKIPFEGANDVDEGENGKIHYNLECSEESRIRESNCYRLFDLIIFSQSLINQNDQLGIKLNPNSVQNLLNQYELNLFAFNLNENKEKQMINSMKIRIKIKKILEKPKFVLSEHKFIVKQLRKGLRIGKIDVKTNIFNEKILFQIENQTKDFEMNSKTGELFLLNENLNFNEISLFISAFYLTNSSIYSTIEIEIYFRLISRLNENILINYQLNSSSLQQFNHSNQFFIQKTNFYSNEILFSIQINSFDYPSDQFHLFLFNYQSLFSLLFIRPNLYLLKLQNNSSLDNLILIIQIKHQLTNQYLSNLVIQFTRDEGVRSPTNLCEINSTFHLYQINKTKFISKLQVIQTYPSIFSFSTFVIGRENQLIIDQCPMMIMEDENITLNQSQYELCSNQCFQISLINETTQKILMLKRFLSIRPIEMIILCVSIVFILATITLMIIICRLRGFHLCLAMKNYLFYGKKYGLNRAQRLSSNKITQRVHSIVVRESQSPSISHIKSIEPYIFNINKYFEEEKIPSINLRSESSPEMRTSLSCTSSLDRGERTISNVDQELNKSSIPTDKNQLLQMITSNDQFDSSRLASEV